MRPFIRPAGGLTRRGKVPVRRSRPLLACWLGNRQIEKHPAKGAADIVPRVAHLSSSVTRKRPSAHDYGGAQGEPSPEQGDDRGAGARARMLESMPSQDGESCGGGGGPVLSGGHMGSLPHDRGRSTPCTHSDRMPITAVSPPVVHNLHAVDRIACGTVDTWPRIPHDPHIAGGNREQQGDEQ